MASLKSRDRNRFRLDELIRKGLSAPTIREVIADPHARYFGAEVSEAHSFQVMTRGEGPPWRGDYSSQYGRV